MSNSTTKIFADRMQELIATSGKTIKVLADEIVISAGALSKYQNDGAEAGIDALVKIAKYFEVSTDWLLGLTEIKSTDVSIQKMATLTGLSNGAIENLTSAKSVSEEYLKSPESDAAGGYIAFYELANLLLEDYPAFYSLAMVYRTYSEAMQKVGGVPELVNADDAMDAFLMSIKDPDKYYLTNGELADFSLYQMQQLFGEIIDAAHREEDTP